MPLLVVRLLGGLLVATGALIALAGLAYGMVMYAVMSSYPDQNPNTLVQNITPLMMYVLPAVVCGGGLGAFGLSLCRRA